MTSKVNTEREEDDLQDTSNYEEITDNNTKLLDKEVVCCEDSCGYHRQ